MQHMQIPEIQAKYVKEFHVGEIYVFFPLYKDFMTSIIVFVVTARRHRNRNSHSTNLPLGFEICNLICTETYKHSKIDIFDYNSNVYNRSVRLQDFDVAWLSEQ